MDPSGSHTAQGPGAPEEPAPTGGAYSTATGAEPTAPASPEQALDVLHAQLSTAESNVSAGQQGLQVLRTQVGSLEKSAGDIGKVVEAFGAARPRLASRADEAARFLECEKAVVDEKVGDERAGVERAYTAVSQRLARWEQQLADEQTALGEIWDEQRQREKAVTEAQAGFDELKARQKRVDDALKELEGLRGQLEKADKLDDGPRMLILYKLAQERSDALGTQLVTAEELRGSLDAAWLDLYDLQRQLRETVDRRTGAELRIQRLTIQIEALRTDRVEVTLKEYRQTSQYPDGPHAAGDTTGATTGGTTGETAGASTEDSELQES